jgi:hypothetical protein
MSGRRAEPGGPSLPTSPETVTLQQTLTRRARGEEGDDVQSRDERGPRPRSSRGGANPELVERPRQRRFTAEYKLQILSEVDRWQAVSMSDIAFDADGVAALITSLDLKRHEPRFSLDAAEIWEHGAIVYRRAHSKIKAERIVPSPRHSPWS